MIYTIWNGVAPTTAAFAKQATSTSIRTMLQIAAGANVPLKIKEWGFSLDGFAAAAPGTIELFGTSVAASGLSALANTDIALVDFAAKLAGAPISQLIQVGAALSGFTASTTCTEGTVANYQGFDLQLAPPTNGYTHQFPLGTEPIIEAGKFARIRATFAASVNMICYVTVEA